MRKQEKIKKNISKQNKTYGMNLPSLSSCADKQQSKNNKKQVANRTNINIKQPIHGRVTYSRACLTKRRLMLLAIQQNGKQLANFINNESVGCSRLSLEPAASIGASNAKG